MNYGMRFVTLYRRQGSRPSPWKRKAKTQNGFLGMPHKQLRKEEKLRHRRKGKIYPFEYKVPKNNKEE